MLLAFQISLKANAILLVFLALVVTTPLVTIGQALHDLRVSPKLIYLLLFTYRYIHVMEQEYRRLWNACLIRGFRPRTDQHTYRTFAHLVGMLLVRSQARAERIQAAMVCRGFQGRFYSLHQFAFGGRDLLFLLLLALAFLLLLGLEWQNLL